MPGDHDPWHQGKRVLDIGFGELGQGGPVGEIPAPQKPVDAPAGASEWPAEAREYRPGVCNIGPVEIARRRRAGHVGLAATAVTLGVLVAIDAPPAARLLVALPAASAAAGYLQATLHFCAGFGSRGVFNFGPLGETRQVADDDARARDRSKAVQIGLASIAIGVAAGAGAALLPR